MELMVVLLLIWPAPTTEIDRTVCLSVNTKP